MTGEKTGMIVNWKTRTYGPWYETAVTWQGLTPGQQEILLEQGPAALGVVLANAGYHCIPASKMKAVDWDDRAVRAFRRRKRIERAAQRYLHSE